ARSDRTRFAEPSATWNSHGGAGSGRAKGRWPIHQHPSGSVSIGYGPLRPIIDAMERVLQVEGQTFVTAINCIDGRAQDPVAEWMRDRFSVRYVDTITEAGADGILANGREAALELVKS